VVPREALDRSPADMTFGAEMRVARQSRHQDFHCSIKLLTGPGLASSFEIGGMCGWKQTRECSSRNIPILEFRVHAVRVTGIKRNGTAIKKACAGWVRRLFFRTT
jgi:hypothetical protein